MRKVSSTPCVSTSFSSTDDSGKSAVHSEESKGAATAAMNVASNASPRAKHMFLSMTPIEEISTASTAHPVLSPYPGHMAATHTFMHPSPTLAECAASIALGPGTNVNSAPPTPFPDLTCPNSWIGSPRLMNLNTPKGQPSVFFQDVENLYQKSPSLTLGFGGTRICISPVRSFPEGQYPHSATETRSSAANKKMLEIPDDVHMAERDLLEDDDLSVLLQLAQTQHQQTQQASTSSILAASSLHLPLINNSSSAPKTSSSVSIKNEGENIEKSVSKGTVKPEKVSPHKKAKKPTKSGFTPPPLPGTEGHMMNPLLSQAGAFRGVFGGMAMGPNGPTPIFLPPPMPSNVSSKLPSATPQTKLKKKKKNSTPRTTAAKSNSGDAGLLRGVTMRPSGKWQAQLYFAGKSRYIGVFDTREKAATAYEIAREKLKNKDALDGGTLSPEETEAAVSAARKAAFAGIE